MSEPLLEIVIKAVMPTANGCAIFLGNPEKTFVIYVDQGIGNSLSMAINQEKKERPMTHDLIDNIFSGFGVQLERVIINGVKEGTFFARILLKMENELGIKFVEIDARPSDSLVIAMMQKRPIFVLPTVFENVEDMTEVFQKISQE